MERKYCQGGGFKPKDDFYQVCVFCKHPFVDEIPENKNELNNNRAKEKAHNELKKHFDVFKTSLF